MSGIQYSQPKQQFVNQTIQFNKVLYNSIPSKTQPNFFNDNFTVGDIQNNFDILIISGSNQQTIQSMIFDIQAQQSIGVYLNGANFILDFKIVINPVFYAYAQIQFGSLMTDRVFNFDFSNLNGMTLTIRGIKFQSNQLTFLYQ